MIAHACMMSIVADAAHAPRIHHVNNVPRRDLLLNLGTHNMDSHNKFTEYSLNYCQLLVTALSLDRELGAGNAARSRKLNKIIAI